MRKILLLMSVLGSLAMLSGTAMAHDKGFSYRQFGKGPSVQIRVGHGKRIHKGRRFGRGDRVAPHRIKHIRTGHGFHPKRKLFRKHGIGRKHRLHRGRLYRPGHTYSDRVYYGDRFYRESGQYREGHRRHRPNAVIHRLSPRRGVVDHVQRHHDGGLKILKGGRPVTVIIDARPARRKHLQRY